MPRYIELRAPDGSPVLLNADAVRRAQPTPGGTNIDDAYYKNDWAQVRELLAPDLVAAEAKAREAQAGEEVQHAEPAHAEPAHAEPAHAAKAHAKR